MDPYLNWLQMYQRQMIMVQQQFAPRPTSVNPNQLLSNNSAPAIPRSHPGMNPALPGPIDPAPHITNEIRSVILKLRYSKYSTYSSSAHELWSLIAKDLQAEFDQIIPPKKIFDMYLYLKHFHVQGKQAEESGNPPSKNWNLFKDRFPRKLSSNQLIPFAPPPPILGLHISLSAPLNSPSIISTLASQDRSDQSELSIPERSTSRSSKHTRHSKLDSQSSAAAEELFGQFINTESSVHIGCESRELSFATISGINMHSDPTKQKTCTEEAAQEFYSTLVVAGYLVTELLFV